jgi:tyrosine-protein phosphatase SIW14
MQQEIEFLAPENFSMVEPGVYRSAFPRTKNIGFLKRLGLKAVLPLVPEDYPTAMADFYNQCGTKLLSHGLDGNKWPFKQIDIIEFSKVLKDVLNPKNRPILIHCNKGKHRTGSVIGCLRKLRGWALSSIFHEYLSFSAPKSRLEDQIFIESFDVDNFYNNDLSNIIILEKDYKSHTLKELRFEDSTNSNNKINSNNNNNSYKDDRMKKNIDYDNNNNNNNRTELSSVLIDKK